MRYAAVTRGCFVSLSSSLLETIVILGMFTAASSGVVAL
jgi:hypothetical protein